MGSKPANDPNIEGDRKAQVLDALRRAGVKVEALEPTTRAVVENLSVEEALTLASISERLNEADASLMLASGGINH